MKTAKTLILGILIVLFILFVVQNYPTLTQSQTLKLNLLLTTVETPPLMMVLMLVVCFVLGFAAAFVIGYAQRRRLRKDLRQVNQRLKRTEEELNHLRNLPITTVSHTDSIAANGQAPKEGG
jgi:uncharacterized membrane protein YciS (DUF1049 family)